MPETPAPIFCRNSHSSTTCGSVAAWRISVTPSARRGGEQRRLRPGNRRLVEVHRRALQAVGRLEHVVGPCAERAPIASSASRCVEIVRRAGKSPPGGAMCARPSRASSGPSSSTEPRSRPTSAAIGIVLPAPAGSDPQRRGPDAIDLGADVEQQPRHHLDVADARHVRQHALVFGQQARGEQRQRRVLVAFDGDPPWSRCRLQSAVSTCLFQDPDPLSRDRQTVIAVSQVLVLHVRIRREADEYRLGTQRDPESLQHLDA